MTRLIELSDPVPKLKPNGVKRNELGQILPGEVLNPEGRPLASVSLADKLRQRLTNHPEEAEGIVGALIELGLAKDMRAIEHAFHYIDGKPVETRRIEGELPIKLIFIPAEQVVEGEVKEISNGQNSQGEDEALP